MALNASDVIDGARVPDRPGLYVVGCYDTRITFYSQQIRALELVYALHEQGHLAKNQQIAVIGGGAAGITVAAALLMSCDADIYLFERAPKFLSLQSASNRRRLDPHLYDWPQDDTDHEIAELPLLDWRSESANKVRQAVIQEFNTICETFPNRIKLLTQHDVKTIRPMGTGYQIEFDRERTNSDAADAGERISDRKRVHLVMFAFGFGLEPVRPIANVAMESYWSDSGIPGPEFDGSANPRFFISGNGDGGLIDLIAAASADFSHAATIRAIIHQQGVSELFTRLKSIDIEARQKNRAGEMFNFVAAYDEKILQTVSDLGLIALMRSRLRPGVQLTLQTTDAELMSVKTAIINRLAVYLTIKACELEVNTNFQHVVCQTVNPGNVPAGAQPAAFWFECAGVTIGADKAIFRRGPDGSIVRQPFNDVLAGYSEHHEKWLKRHGDSTIVPILSLEARAFFEQKRKNYGLPIPHFRQEALAAQIPLQIKIQRSADLIHWTGDFAPEDASASWGSTFPVKIYCRATPEELGIAAHSIARLAIHGANTTFVANVPAWQPLLEKLTLQSQQTENFLPPNLKALQQEGMINNPRDISPELLRQLVNSSLDAWTLRIINEQLQSYLVNDVDPAHRIGFKTTPELRNLMHQTWCEWHQNFLDDPLLLGRFLRLIMCAIDTDESTDEVYVLVGRLKMPALIRSTAMAIAVATAWPSTIPHAVRPGNLARTVGTNPVLSGHACAAERINGQRMELSASKFNWRTNFLVLPMVTNSLDFSNLANISIAKTDEMQPALTDLTEQTNIVITFDEAFISAAAQGAEALVALMVQAEVSHFRELRKGIQEVNT